MSKETNNHKRWMKEARLQKATHILDVVDEFDYSHYPVYISSSEEVKKIKEKYNQKSMQKVHLVIEVSDSIILKDIIIAEIEENLKDIERTILLNKDNEYSNTLMGKKIAYYEMLKFINK